jgi:hypothetical protein
MVADRNKKNPFKFLNKAKQNADKAGAPSPATNQNEYSRLAGHQILQRWNETDHEQEGTLVKGGADVSDAYQSNTNDNANPNTKGMQNSIDVS